MADDLGRETDHTFSDVVANFPINIVRLEHYKCMSHATLTTMLQTLT